MNQIATPAPPLAREKSAPRVLISGYYGFENLGDDLILRVLVDALKVRGYVITVLSQNPALTRRDFGVHAIYRMRPLDILEAMANTDFLISGGGGLFQDATGPMSAIYYGGLIHLARCFGVTVCVWAQGVGPLTSSLARRISASAFKRCQAIIVRDQNSAALIESLTGRMPAVSADPVWLLKPEQLKAHQSTATQTEAQTHIGISLRSWGLLTPARLNNLAIQVVTFARTLPAAKSAAIHLLPFQSEEDTALLESFASTLRQQADCPPVILETPASGAVRLADCQYLIGMRFHSLILGLLAGVKVFGLIYDPKVATLLSLFGLSGCGIDALEGLTSANIVEAFQAYPSIDLAPFQQEAEKNMAVLDTLKATFSGDLLRAE